jgi:hypothetical protein
VYVTYAQIDELTITKEEAARVVLLLREDQEGEDFFGSKWLKEIERRWGQGEDMRELAREVVKTCYILNQKWGGAIEMFLDIYATVGIEPPEQVARRIGHGDTIS